LSQQLSQPLAVQHFAALGHGKGGTARVVADGTGTRRWLGRRCRGSRCLEGRCLEAWVCVAAASPGTPSAPGLWLPAGVGAGAAAGPCSCLAGRAGQWLHGEGGRERVLLPAGL